MKRISLIILIPLFVFTKISGQEFDLDIQVSTPKLQQVDPKVFQTLEASIQEFYNNSTWTNDEYEKHERIQGSVTLTILEDVTTTSFKAELRIQSNRPVFDSNYKSPTITLVDGNVNFGYSEYQPIELSVDSYSDNLSSILTFYGYMMLGFDYDTFSSQGGEDHFLSAQNTYNSIPKNVADGDRGWESSVLSRNRFSLLDNVLNPKVKPLRQAIYDYHRLSLDNMTKDAEKSKAILVSCVTTLQQVDKSYVNNMIVQTFIDTKREEIVEIFKGASRGQQEKVYDILVNIDPSQASLYGTIK